VINQNDAVDKGRGGLSPCTVEEVTELVFGGGIVIDFESFGGEKGAKFREPLTVERIRYNDDVGEVGDGIKACKKWAFRCWASGYGQ
jgi:hypothetical protein